ncbi:MAG: phasin family protein [Acidobacteriota bacterium]
MGKKKKNKKSKKDVQDEILDSAHRIWLAGLGALTTVEEQGSKLFKSLVERGKSMEKEGRKTVGKAKDKVEVEFDRAKDKVEEGVGKVGETVEQTLSDALHRFGVPTRDEIHTLVTRVEELNKKVDDLRKAPRTTTARKPAARKPAARKPAARKPAAKKPAAKAASTRKPAAKSATARKPAAKKTPTAAKKPAAKTTTARKPAARKPASKSTASKPS